jgi:hypothetical protein
LSSGGLFHTAIDDFDDIIKRVSLGVALAVSPAASNELSGESVLSFGYPIHNF